MVNTQENIVVQQDTTKVETKQNDKEFNFRQQEAKYERILANERAEKERLARENEELKQSKLAVSHDEDDDSEPYVDNKKLEKKLAKFGEQTEKKTVTNIQRAVQDALQEERKQNWLKENSDFFDVMQNHAQTFLEKVPQLAETILKMPEGFERQKLVYQNIKALALDKPQPKQSSIQEKIDANRRSPYYQPTGVGTAPYNSSGDFSEAGKKNAYANMKKLQQNLSLG